MESEIPEDVIGVVYTKFHKMYPNVRVETEVPEEIMLVPMVYPMIVQVFMNLMENSVEHGERVSTIWLKVRKEGEFAVFTVEDDGVGYSPERGSHVSADAKSRNMGVGLELCDSFVETHGGTLEKGNRPEGGARMSFRLPISEETYKYRD